MSTELIVRFVSEAVRLPMGHWAREEITGSEGWVTGYKIDFHGALRVELTHGDAEHDAMTSLVLMQTTHADAEREPLKGF